MSLGRPKTAFRSDLEMWHKFIDFGKWVAVVAQAEETNLYSLCIHYSFSTDDYESNCDCGEITRLGGSGDFDPGEECWECPFYRTKEMTSSVGNRTSKEDSTCH